MKSPSRRNKNRPLYKPKDELMYLGQQRVMVHYWAGDMREYLCHCPAWGEDIWCQEKDLKPIEDTK